MIYYCTKLKQAGSEEKVKIEEEIAQQPGLHYILDQLRGLDAQGDVHMVGVLNLSSIMLAFRLKSKSERRKHVSVDWLRPEQML